MTIVEQRQLFEANAKIYESVIVTFEGVEGFDVYNPSIPFVVDGERYIYGRVEKRDEWATSWVRLFKEVEQDRWRVVDDTITYQLEDPYIAQIGKEIILGGTHVQKMQGEVATYYGYFYRGKHYKDQVYFTTGPDYMKDIRLVELAEGSIGVFSRPRSEEIRKKYGSESIIGFKRIECIDDLNAEVINEARVIDGLFDKDEWGGCNQAYLLDSGYIGVIGHKCYKATDEQGILQKVYMNSSFIFDWQEHKVMDLKIIGTRRSYPKGPTKKEGLADCAFTSGICKRADGKVDLYSGIGDVEVGRIVIDNPFEGYGQIV